MKKQSFQTKRRPTGGLFVFHSKTRRRKTQRVAASADLGSEVPNLGVARALFVILVLHVAAIAAIFIHNRVTDDDLVASSDPPAAAAAAGGAPASDLARPKGGEDFYFVATGDTYERIAKLKGVDVNDLRDLNDNKPLGPGRVLRIPAGGIVPPAEVAVAAVEPEVVPSAPPVEHAPVPAVVKPNVSEPALLAAPNPPIYVRRDEPAAPIVVADETAGERPPAAAVPVTESSDPARSAGGTYKVKSGDTAWAIAREHRVSVNSLLKANGITDARKLRADMTLRIPAN